MEYLIATPVTALDIMAGKLAPYLAIGLLDAALCAAFSVGWFGVPFRGGLGAFFLTTTLFLIVILGIGYMISVSTRSQLGASQYALLVTLLPTAMLSGFAFPIEEMPAPIRAIAYVVYSRYYVSALKRIFLTGAVTTDLGWQIAAMSLYALVVGFFATRVFRKSLQ
jgi:ABC-2 type transport system permease protein